MRNICIGLVLLLTTAVFSLNELSSQAKTTKANVNQNIQDDAASIIAKKRGFPHISFDDGKDLSFPVVAGRNASHSKLMTASDFDSDGTIDLITADTGGILRLYRGNIDSIYPNSPEAQKRKANGTFNEQAFYPNGKSFSLTFSPDFLTSGDFNADGFQDILATSKYGSSLYLLSGDGRGNLRSPLEIKVDGVITAFAAGEIGRRDGQTDIAVAVSGEKGSSLLVFEHPEGAFKYRPETVKLPAAANSLAIGNLDQDDFADIAVGSGNKLTLVHGRGQAYPFDLLEKYDVKRPEAIVETRILSFEIAAMEIGNFTKKRTDSLAILTSSGMIQTLESPKVQTIIKSNGRQSAPAIKAAFPTGETGKSFSKFKTLPQKNIKERENMFPADRQEREKVLQERKEKFAKELESLNLQNKDQFFAEKSKLNKESRQRAKEGFLKSISPAKSAPLSSWVLQNMISDARLASAAFSPITTKLIKVRVSESEKDELAVTDTAGKQIHLILPENAKSKSEQTPAGIVSFDVETRPLAILPMRLNTDALSDLVVLRENSFAPTIVLTAPVSTFVVNSTNDGSICDESGCTLRGAINAANNNLGPDLITFNIGGGLQTILPGSQLPRTEGTVTIDGTTQSGFSGTPLIEIKGTNAGISDGVSINSSNSVVRGLIVNEFQSDFDYDENYFVGGNGIVVLNFTDTFGRNNIVEGNFLGIDPTGMLDKGNDATGINIFDSDDNLVGGTTAAARNVMSGSGDNNQPRDIRRFGVGLSVVDGKNTQIKGNYIGTNSSGTLKINNSWGVYLATPDSDFGGNEAGAGNVVSGNGDPYPATFDPNRCFGEGIQEATVINLDTGEFVTRNINYKGNLIGTNAAGNAGLGNCNPGIQTSPYHMSNVGSIAASGRNTISGNQENALYCSPFPRGQDLVEPLGTLELNPGFCNIAGNNFGTDIAGNTAIPNLDRNLTGNFVFAFGTVSVFNTDTFSNIGAPGGTSPTSCTGFCNLVSGNEDAVGIVRYGSEGFVGIFNNYSGTNKNGTAALPNYGGVETSFNGPETLVGGIGVDETNGLIPLGNLISGNFANGINVGSFVTVEGNLIGTDITGINPIPNGSDPDTFGTGVAMGGFFSIVGGSHPLARNIIAGNAGSGVDFYFDSLFGEIINNSIGINKDGQPLGNGEDGITMQGGSFSVIAGNVIANNTRNGIYIVRGNTIGVLMRFNSIYNNGTLGIDLSANTSSPFEPDGVTPNDCADLDGHANGLQNFPVLTAPLANGDGTVSIEGAFQSKPSSGFVMDFYSNSSADPSDYGEGETYIGSKVIQTDEDGIATFLFTSNDPVNSNLKFTATATNEFGETSEFSCFAGQCEGGTGGLSEKQLRDLVFPICGQTIVVNVNTDEPDTSPSNGVCDVDLSTPGLQCSLRGAIQMANARSGYDLIIFDIPGGGVQTIAPASQLPFITGDTFLDATSQPGYVASPMIELRGDAVAPGGYGLGLANGSNLSVISGFAINRFTYGIGIVSKSVTVKKCYLGLSADGSPTVTLDGNRNLAGVYIDASTATNNLIGGITDDSQNVISNNAIGVHLHNGPKNNRVFGNKIGTDPTGNNAIPNSFGILTEDADFNQIGSEENGNIISGNTLAGVYISDGSASNKIGGNKIGTKANGVEVLPNEEHGAYFTNGAKNNLLEKNVIGGQTGTGGSAGVYISDLAGINNKVMENWIGVAADGTTALPNTIGIAILADGQMIGDQSAGNIIGNNGRFGIYIVDEPAGPNPVVENNLVQYNLIGTNGTAEIGNGEGGIVIGGNSQNNTVSKNIVSGNQVFGIFVGDGASSNGVTQNFIGTNTSGTAAIPNRLGIWVEKSTNNTFESNLVSGNYLGMLIGADIGLEPLSQFVKKYNSRKSKSNVGVPVYTTGNRVFGNTVGLNAGRTAAIPNDIGIFVGENARDNIIGSETGNYNLISGNTATLGYGIFLGTLTSNPPQDSLPQLNKFFGNIIGLAGNLETPISNKKGFVIQGANNNTIGGNSDLSANTVIGSTEEGVLISDNASNNIFLKNYFGIPSTIITSLQNGRSSSNQLGTNYGNGGSGIVVTNGAQGNTLGGATPETGLVIGTNGGNGITITSTAGNGNSFGANRIFGNTGLGIDLGGNGSTVNDPGDADSGPNNLQNYPEIVSKQIVNDELIIDFKVDSAPANSDYGSDGILVKFFKADTSGEGENYLGAVNYTVSDYNSLVPGTKTVNLGDINVLGITPTDPITATATDASGNSSEFMPTLAPTAAEVSVSGRVLMSQNGPRGIPGVTVSLTDQNGIVRTVLTNSFGYYEFSEVEAGQVVILNAFSKEYQFTPRLINVDDTRSDIDFIPQ